MHKAAQSSVKWYCEKDSLPFQAIQRKHMWAFIFSVVEVSWLGESPTYLWNWTFWEQFKAYDHLLLFFLRSSGYNPVEMNCIILEHEGYRACRGHANAKRHITLIYWTKYITWCINKLQIHKQGYKYKQVNWVNSSDGLVLQTDRWTCSKEGQDKGGARDLNKAGRTRVWMSDFTGKGTDAWKWGDRREDKRVNTGQEKTPG